MIPDDYYETNDAELREICARTAEALTEATPIVELFTDAEVHGVVPPSLAQLVVPRACCTDASAQLYTCWPKVNWADLQTQRQVLSETKRWDLLEEFKQLCRVVEPVMRAHPERGLREAFGLIAAEGSDAQVVRIHGSRL
jgi:hypothetical protein